MTNSNVNTNISTIGRLADTSYELFIANIPSCVWEDDGEPNRPNYHWSSTKAAAEVILGRKMTKDEVTILSLGRYFGPTPALEDAMAQEVLSFLWPDGNSYGAGLDWGELADQLRDYITAKTGAKATVRAKAKDMAAGIVAAKHPDSYYGPYNALNNYGRLFVRIGKVGHAVLFAETLVKELQEQTLAAALAVQCPAWGHLKNILPNDLPNDSRLFELRKRGSLPEKIYSAAAATLQAKLNFQQFIREPGVIEHLQHI